MPVPLQVEKRWLNLGRFSAGTELTIRYPLLERMTIERVGGNTFSKKMYTNSNDNRECHVYWLGNRVVAMTPTGEVLPIRWSQ